MLSGRRPSSSTSAPGRRSNRFSIIAKLISVTIYSIWHRKGRSTASGFRNLIKYNYWRTASPCRDWIVDPDVDVLFDLVGDGVTGGAITLKTGTSSVTTSGALELPTAASSTTATSGDASLKTGDATSGASGSIAIQVHTGIVGVDV